MRAHQLIAAALTLALVGCGVTSGTPGNRSAAAVAEFKQSNPCPATGSSRGACPGYEVDHRKPLAAGGADRPSNMQWLSKSQHRAKTASERRACVYGCKTNKR